MKKYLIFFLLIPIITSAQKNSSSNFVQVGPVISFYKDGGMAYGGELTGNWTIKNFPTTVGIGMKALKFKDVENVYLPITLSVKEMFELKDCYIFLNLEPGYGIYNSSSTVFNESVNVNGGFYLNTGIGIAGKSRTTGYLTLNYSFYQFTSKTKGIFNSSGSSNINAITATAGIWLWEK